MNFLRTGAELCRSSACVVVLGSRSVSGRSTVRKPLKRFKPTLTGDELFELQPKDANLEIADQAEAAVRPGRRLFKMTPRRVDGDDNHDSKEEDHNYLPDTFDKSKLPPYEKIFAWEKDHPLYKTLRRQFSLIHSARPSKDSELVVLEGHRTILEAVNAGLSPVTLVFSRLNLLLDFPLDRFKDTKLVQIPYKNISAWSELSKSPGFMATFRKDEIKSVSRLSPDPLPIHLVVENIRMPDNLGSLLRVAAAVGCQQVIAMSGCSNIWNPKTIRSAAGAHLKVPVVSGVTWDVLHNFVPNTSQVVIADLLSKGYEKKIVTQNVTERLKHLENASRDFHFQNTECDGFTDCSYFEDDILRQYSEIPLTTHPFHDLEVYGQTEIVVVVGGETHGVSDQAYKFAHHHYGQKVFVPLRNKIESLNTASAASVILFEVQKKILENGSKN